MNANVNELAKQQSAQIQEAASAISVVLVSYNSADVIEAALRSIDESAEIIVVDNASADDTCQRVATSRVRLVQNSNNLGFGSACNIGAKAATRDYILFLNPDARLRRGALAALVAAGNTRLDCVAFNPRILEPSGAQSQRRMSRLLPPSINVRLRDSLVEDCNVEMLSGAALFCRRDAFEAVGGFDERIFLYCEDDDLAVRFRQNGHQLGYVHAAVVEHIGGASAPQTPAGQRFKAYHFMRSTRYAMGKHQRPFRRNYLTLQASLKYALAVLTFDAHQRWKYQGYLKALIENPDY